jgi:hypothetical protein
MAERQNAFVKKLMDNGIKVYYPVLIDRSLFDNSPYNILINEVYKNLGGVLSTYPIDFGNFDIILEDAFIEIDEENHFNRYRKLTLQTSLYPDHKYFPVSSFISFCEEYELKAQRTGGYWSNGGSEKQFGNSSPPGDFAGNGPSRWKQRAFYDFLKDVYCKVSGIPVYRISIYEKIGSNTINKILKSGNTENGLLQFLKGRNLELL